MKQTLYAFLMGTVAILIALLSVFDIVPASVAQMVPLMAVPFIIQGGRKSCTAGKC